MSAQPNEPRLEEALYGLAYVLRIIDLHRNQLQAPLSQEVHDIIAHIAAMLETLRGRLDRTLLTLLAAQTREDGPAGDEAQEE